MSSLLELAALFAIALFFKNKTQKESKSLVWFAEKDSFEMVLKWNDSIL